MLWCVRQFKSCDLKEAKLRMGNSVKNLLVTVQRSTTRDFCDQLCCLFQAPAGRSRTLSKVARGLHFSSRQIGSFIFEDRLVNDRQCHNDELHAKNSSILLRGIHRHQKFCIRSMWMLMKYEYVRQKFIRLQSAAKVGFLGSPSASLCADSTDSATQQCADQR